jgi:hypothetical protein
MANAKQHTTSVSNPSFYASETKKPANNVLYYPLHTHYLHPMNEDSSSTSSASFHAVIIGFYLWFG